MTAGLDEAAVIAAYSATGGRWQVGPGVIYDRLAAELIAASPVDVRGAVVLDVGTGTGAATRAVFDAGAREVVPIDAALGMLQVDATNRPPAVCGDARALPLRDESVDLAVAAFSLNHLGDPVPAFREITRVLRPGGGAVVGTYAIDDAHPVKDAVEQALTRAGWRSPGWHAWLKHRASVVLSTLDSARDAAARADLGDVEVGHRRVAFPDLDPEQLIAWRFGMAQHAPFVDALGPARRERLFTETRRRLGECPPLVRSIIVLTFRR